MRAFSISLPSFSVAGSEFRLISLAVLSTHRLLIWSPFLAPLDSSAPGPLASTMTYSLISPLNPRFT
ncbi:hypothetical protein BON30_34040 [Cystobacter ferrugineus]|uniref:Uncharacterized protein n=1 Tax=Cystobacter ferrugineus TaxID=83449 RepID=A0A1L9B1Q2_9BACT|nr:hypothetical protein BON30_34040 [Cystobacter ferrugineus]